MRALRMRRVAHSREKSRDTGQIELLACRLGIELLLQNRRM